MSRQTIIDLWRTSESPDWAYFDRFEAGENPFWTSDSVWLQYFNKLDTEAVLEIACGKGRHAAECAAQCGVLHLVDTSVDAIAIVRERFKALANVVVHLSEDGASLEFLPDACLTAAFSYDAMVHFEVETMAAYLREIGRVLRPGGLALLHHSNNSAEPTKPVTESAGWRNYMTRELMQHLVVRAGLEVIEHRVVGWATPTSDALSLVRRPVGEGPGV